MGPAVFFGVTPWWPLNKTACRIGFTFQTWEATPIFILSDKIAKRTKTIIMQIKQI